MTIAESNRPVPENVERIIAEKGLKKSFVAERSKLTPKEFSYILSGRRRLRAIDICKLAKALGVSPGELLKEPK